MTDDMKSNVGMTFNVERYRVHDGSGIRTAVFMKGCLLACPWCSNPESQSRQIEIALHRNLCRKCGTCVRTCPQGAIMMKLTGEDTRPDIDRRKCLACGACVRACPNDAMEVYGSEKDAAEIVDALKKDMAFYTRSGGGITVTGGEPTLQADFVSTIMRACKDECLHTAIETCGFASWENMWKSCEFCDEILYDIKTMIPEQFDTLLGDAVCDSNALECVKNNVRLLCANGKNVTFRCVIIPGFNDNLEHIKAVCEFAEENGVEQIDLLPFHQYGKHKYMSLGKQYTYAAIPALEDEAVEEIAQYVRNRGIVCTVGG